MRLDWELLYNDNSSFPRMLHFGVATDERFCYGIDDQYRRSLYFYYPKEGLHSHQDPVVFANIKLEDKVVNLTPALVLTLLNDNLNNLFDDLIISLVTQMRDSSHATKARFNGLCNEWFELFEPLQGSFSRSDVQGLFAELYFLEFLLTNGKGNYNEILRAWKGPYGKGHDFELENLIFEVKSLVEGKQQVHISSEFQLDFLEGQELRLVVVEFYLNPENSVPVSVIIQRIITLLRAKPRVQINLFWSALSKIGITISNLEDLDHLLFEVKTARYYDCSSVEFPLLRRSVIPDSLRNIRYDISLQNHKFFDLSYLTPLI